MQCKVPLNYSQPDVNICVLEYGHSGPHFTYTLDWDIIEYTAKHLTERIDNAEDHNDSA